MPNHVCPKSIYLGHFYYLPSVTEIGADDLQTGFISIQHSVYLHDSFYLITLFVLTQTYLCLLESLRSLCFLFSSSMQIVIFWKT